MRIKDLISPKRWVSFNLFLLKKLLKIMGEDNSYLEPYEIEQYMYRLLKCPDCVKEGKCIGHFEGEEPCNCHTIGRMNNRKDTCSIKKWGVFQSKDNWEITKKERGIVFTLQEKSIN